jgi:hypothetical protein
MGLFNRKKKLNGDELKSLLTKYGYSGNNNEEVFQFLHLIQTLKNDVISISNKNIDNDTRLVLHTLISLVEFLFNRQK